MSHRALQPLDQRPRRKEHVINSFHSRIEAVFEGWGLFIFRFRWIVLLFFVGTTTLFATQLPKVEFIDSVELLLRPTDPTRVQYDAFREQFGQDDLTLLVLRPPALFSLESLEKLRALHEDIETSVPYVDEVTSLLNIRSTTGRGDELIVEDLMEEWPRTPEDLAALRARVLSTPLYRGTLIDEEGKVTLIAIKPITYAPTEEENFDFEESSPSSPPEFLSDALRTTLLAHVQEIVERHNTPDFPVEIAGIPYTNVRLRDGLMDDMKVFAVASVIANVFLLLLLFRRWSGVLFPLVVVIVSLVSVYGIMGRFGIPGSSAGQVVPILIIAVGICHAVHILTIVFQLLAQGHSKRDAIAKALAHSGLAVLMTSLTTAGGMVSFIVADSSQFINVGIIAPIGVMLAFLYTVSLLPALLAVSPLRTPKTSTALAHANRLSGVLARLGDVATQHSDRVLIATGLLVAIGGVGIANLHMSQQSLRWFPEHEPARITTERLDADMHGSSTLEIVIDTGIPDGLYEPDTLRRIDTATQRIVEREDSLVPVGKATSLIDVIKETHQALNGNDPAHYALPTHRDLVAQELLLFENSGSDDLEEIVDSQFRTARVSLSVPNVDGKHYPAFIAFVTKTYREALGDGVTVSCTGIVALIARSFDLMVTSLARSYTLALIIITPLMILLIGNLRMGLLSMVPNLLPIYLTLSLMGWLGIPVDPSTLLIGCIIIGLAVDDTIHFMHKFQRYFEESGDIDHAVHQTLATTGSALLFTTLVLTAGFLVMALAYMQNTADFGKLAAFATVTAFLADVLVAPALLKFALRLHTGGHQPARNKPLVAHTRNDGS